MIRPCQHDDGYIYIYIYGLSVTDQVRIDERTQVHIAPSSLVVTHPSTNRGRRALTSVNVHWASLGRHRKSASKKVIIYNSKSQPAITNESVL